MVRFYDPAEGRVAIDGVDVRDLPVGELRRAVAIVFEETLLFHDSVAANIAFAVPDAPLADIEAAARLAGAHDFIVELPEGYDTMVGERGVTIVMATHDPTISDIADETLIMSDGRMSRDIPEELKGVGILDAGSMPGTLQGEIGMAARRAGLQMNKSGVPTARTSDAPNSTGHE